MPWIWQRWLMTKHILTHCMYWINQNDNLGFLCDSNNLSFLFFFLLLPKCEISVQKKVTLCQRRRWSKGFLGVKWHRVAFTIKDSSKRLGYKTHLNLKRFLSMWLILLLIFTTLYSRGTRSFLSQASCLDSKGPIQCQVIRARAPCQP